MEGAGPRGAASMRGPAHRGTDPAEPRYRTRRALRRPRSVRHVAPQPWTGIALFSDGRPPPGGALPHRPQKDTMTSRLARLCLAVGLLFALALPSAALAHGGGRHHDRSRACRAVENSRVPRGLTAAQAQSLATACTTRAAAVKAANDAFAAATKSARDAYRAAVAPLNAQVRAAFDAKRTACRADRRRRPAPTPAPRSARRSPRSRRSSAPRARRSAPPSARPPRPARPPSAPRSRRSAPRCARCSPPEIRTGCRRPPPSRRPARPAGFPSPAVGLSPPPVYGSATRGRRAAAWPGPARGGKLSHAQRRPHRPTATAADWHRRQRDLVAASLVACPRSVAPDAPSLGLGVAEQLRELPRDRRRRRPMSWRHVIRTTRQPAT